MTDTPADGPFRGAMQFGKPRDVPFVLKPWAESALREEAEASARLDSESPAPSLQNPTDANGSEAP